MMKCVLFVCLVCIHSQGQLLQWLKWTSCVSKWPFCTSVLPHNNNNISLIFCNWEGHFKSWEGEGQGQSSNENGGGVCRTSLGGYTTAHQTGMKKETDSFNVEKSIVWGGSRWPKKHVVHERMVSKTRECTTVRSALRISIFDLNLGNWDPKHTLLSLFM